MAKWIVRISGYRDQEFSTLLSAKHHVRRESTGGRRGNKVYLVRLIEDVTSVSPDEVADGTFDECFPDDME